MAQLLRFNKCNALFTSSTLGQMLRFSECKVYFTLLNCVKLILHIVGMLRFGKCKALFTPSQSVKLILRFQSVHNLKPQHDLRTPLNPYHKRAYDRSRRAESPNEAALSPYGARGYANHYMLGVQGCEYTMGQGRIMGHFSMPSAKFKL